MWIAEQFPDFFDKVVYFPVEQTDDGTHFDGEYATRERLNYWIKKIFKGHKLLDELQGI